MPKMKTNRSAAKRFSRTASGKVRRNSAFHRHILTKKSQKRKRGSRGTQILHDTNVKQVLEMCPYL